MGFRHFVRFIIFFFFYLFLNISASAKEDLRNTNAKVPEVLSGHILIKIETTMGNIYADLDAIADPITVGHFLHYVDSGFYKEMLFHRIVQGFVVQSGKYNTDFSAKASKIFPLKNQSQKTKLKNTYATISMAHLKADPHSASTEFFINLLDNPKLDSTKKEFGYSVFGKIIEGMEVVEKIAGIKTWERNELLFAPFFPNEAKIKEISRVSNHSKNRK